MAPRIYWIGGFGPFHYDDANQFSDLSPHRFASDRPPIANDDVIRLQDLLANIQLVASANIDNPAAELGGMGSTADGGLLVVYQVAAGANDEYTIYAWDSDPGVADVPYAVDGLGGGMWIAVGGKYHNGEASFGDSVNNFSLAADGTVGLNGTARATKSIILSANLANPSTLFAPLTAAPAEVLIGGFFTLQYLNAGPLELAYFLFHIPEDWDQGTDMLAHIH
jgi:hypothetical protein